MSVTVPLHDYGIQDIEGFLKKYRFVICNNVLVERAIPWLRHRQVLELSDEELIMNEHKTSCQRTGHMVDMLRRRGLNGFNALLEHIEYDYPELFQKFTGQKARPPCKGYRRERPISTLDSLSDFWNLSQKVMGTLVQEKQNRQALGLAMENLKAELEESECQRATMVQQNKELSLRCVEIETQLAHMQEQSNEYRAEKNEAQKECADLRRMMKEYVMKYMDTKEESDKRTMRQASIKERNRDSLHQRNAQLQAEFESLRDECEELRAKLQDNRANQSSASTATNDVIRSQTHEIERLKKDKDMAVAEQMDLTRRLENLEAEYKCSTKEYKEEYLRIRDHSDIVESKLTDAQLKIQSLTESNTIQKRKIVELMAELRQMHYETSTSLTPLSCSESVYNEIGDIYTPKPDPEHGDYEHIKAPDNELIPFASDSEDEDTVCKQREFTGKKPTLHKRPSNSRCNSVDESSGDKRIPSYKRSVSQPAAQDGKLLRGTKEINRASNKVKQKQPLVLYAPGGIFPDLCTQLLAQTQLFTKCPTEESSEIGIVKELLTNGSYIHYEETEPGRYRCIPTTQVRDHMQLGRLRILLNVPPEALTRLRKSRIKPLVIVVKYRGDKKESPEEEELQRIFYKEQYDTCMVSKGEEMSAIVSMITQKCMATSGSERIATRVP